MSTQALLNIIVIACIPRLSEQRHALMAEPCALIGSDLMPIQGQARDWLIHQQLLKPRGMPPNGLKRSHLPDR
jgi:hypothetical protein